MTLLVASIAADSWESLEARIESAWANGAEAVELRIDAFEGDPDRINDHLRANPDRKWIITCRSREEGGRCRGDAQHRVNRICAVARNTAAAIDIEFADWHGSPELHQTVSDIFHDPACSRPQRRLILSAHDFDHPAPPHQRPRIAALLKHGDELPDETIPKLAYHADHINDSFAALDWMHEANGAISAIAMAEGAWTRILAKKLGAFATYCAIERCAPTAPGQLTISDMLCHHRWTSLNPNSRLFCVLGDPVAHSMSPRLFNRWFDDENVNAVYLPLRVAGGADELTSFLEACRERPWLDIGGFSVTTPHKGRALAWASESADRMAHNIGALNTICFTDGRVEGYNTDCHACVRSLAEALGGDQRGLAGLPVDVLGTGGAARAVLYGLPMAGAQVTVYGRSATQVQQMADQYSVRGASWDKRVSGTGKVLVNCSSVGMWPDVSASPMPAEALGGYDLVFDLIYNPLETQLLADAARAGARSLNGLDMFVRQAAMQFELWVGHAPDHGAGYRLVRDALLASGAE